MKKFLKWGRLYRSELGESTHIYDILPRKLSLTRDLPDIFYENVMKFGSRTVFNEVSVVPYKEVDREEKDFFKSQSRSCTKNPRKLFNCLKNIIRDVWPKKKFHLVMHSSGYESRLISLAVKELSKEEGRGWLGEVLFLESELEGSAFKDIMRYEKWGKDQYFVYEDGVATEDYHRRSFEFSNAWKRLNGVMSRPVNLWWEPVEWAQDLGLVPDDDQLQCWSGFGMNELLKALPNVNHYLYQMYHRSQYGAAMKGNNWILPFRSFDYIQKLMKYTPWASVEILRGIDAKLAALKRVTYPYQTISNKLLMKTVMDYEKSFYGKKFPNVNPTDKICFCKWWGSWCLASFCEHLLHTGYEIS